MPDATLAFRCAGAIAVSRGMPLSAVVWGCRETAARQAWKGRVKCCFPARNGLAFFIARAECARGMKFGVGFNSGCSPGAMRRRQGFKKNRVAEYILSPCNRYFFCPNGCFSLQTHYFGHIIGPAGVFLLQTNPQKNRPQAPCFGGFE